MVWVDWDWEWGLTSGRCVLVVGIWTGYRMKGNVIICRWDEFRARSGDDNN
jgi:hypothetical protein